MALSPSRSTIALSMDTITETLSLGLLTPILWWFMTGIQ